MKRTHVIARRGMLLTGLALVSSAAIATSASASPDWAWSMPATTLAGPQGLERVRSLSSGVDATGIVTMAWYERAVGGRDRIMAARYPAPGALTPLAPAVDLTASFGANPGASVPVVAVSPNGDALVAWKQPATAGGYSTVWASTYSASAGAWTTPAELVGPSTALRVDEPRVAAGPQGQFTVAWYAASGAFPNTTAAFVAARFDGGWGSGPVAVSPTYNADSDDWSISSIPAVAADGLGNAVVLWAAKKRSAGGTNPEVSKILSARFTAGSGWSSAASPATVLAATDTGTGAVVFTGLSARGNATGDFVAAWRNFEVGTQMQAVRSQGTGWDTAQNVGTSGGRSDPSIALDDAGTATVAWRNFSSQAVESSTSLGSAPGTWAATVSAPTGGVDPEDYVEIGTSASGDLTVVWDGRDASTSQYKIQANHLAAGTSTWSAATTLQAGAYQNSNWYDALYYPTLAVAPSGIATAAWQDTVNYRPNDQTYPREYFIKGARYAASSPAPGPDPDPSPSNGGSQGTSTGTSGSSASSQPAARTQAEVQIPTQLARSGLPVSASGNVRLPLSCPAGLSWACDASGQLSVTLPGSVVAERRGKGEQARKRVRVLSRFRGVEIASGTTRLYTVRLAPKTYNALRRAGVRRIPATLRIVNQLAGGAPTVSTQRVWLKIRPIARVAVTG